MASAWGDSWGTAWGAAWGDTGGYVAAVVSTGGGIGHGGTTKAQRKPRLVHVEEYESPTEVIKQIEAKYRDADKKGKKQKVKAQQPTQSVVEAPQKWVAYYEVMASNLAAERDQQIMLALIARASYGIQQDIETMRRLEMYRAMQEEESEIMLLLMAA